ncbi:MAG: hypothetical protein KY455_11460 [Euryarchaeota archaeon]|nr:hypothetical protein [Euryarchaeota archaeon]
MRSAKARPDTPAIRRGLPHHPPEGEAVCLSPRSVCRPYPGPPRARFFVLLVAFAMLGMALTTPLADGAFVQSGSILSGDAFSGWTQAGAYTVTDGSDGSRTSAEQNIIDFYTAIGTTNGGTEAPSSTNPIDHFYFRIDTAGTATNKWGKFNLQVNLGSGAAGQVDHLLQMNGVGPTATPPVIVQLNKYVATQPVGAFTSGSITAIASNDPASAVHQSGATTRLAKLPSGTYGLEVAVPVAWFHAPIAASGNVKPDGTGARVLFGAVFSSTGNLGAVGTVKDVLNDASGKTYVLNTNLITGTSTFQDVSATQTAFTAHPQNAATGSSLGTITVEIRDTNGAKVSTAAHEVTLAIGTDPNGGTLSGTKTVAAVSGVATFSGLSIGTAGNGYTLTASAPGLSGTTSNAFNVTSSVGPATKLGIQTQPSSTATAGTAFAQQPAILVQDADGNTVTTDSSTQVTAAIKNGSGTLLGTTTATAVNGVATFTDLKTNTASTITIESTATGLTSITSNSITVSAATADASQTTASVPNGTVGSATTITITVRDAYGNLVTGAGASLAVSITGANTATPTINETGNGAYTATYTPTTAGTDSVAITLSSTAIDGSPYTSTVTSATASKLGIQTQASSTATAGTAFAPQPVILVQHANGNTVTTDSSTQVTAAIKTGSGTLLGTTTVTAVNGVATFTDLKTNTASTITIESTATGLTSITSNSITVSAATADASQTTASVPNGTVGSATTITITVRDAYGNLVTGAGASLAVSITGANTATPAINETGNGVYTASYTPTAGGTDSISVTVGGGAIHGSPFTSVIGTVGPTPTASGGGGGGGGIRTAGPASPAPVEDPVAPVAPIQLTIKPLPESAAAITPPRPRPTPPSLTDEELQQGMGGLDMALLAAIISIGLSSLVVQVAPPRVRVLAAGLLDPKFLRDTQSLTRSLDLVAGAPTAWVPMVMQALETRGGLAGIRMIGSSFLSDTGSLARSLMVGTDPADAWPTRRRQTPEVLPPMFVVRRVDDLPASETISTKVVRIDGPTPERPMSLREWVRSGRAESQHLDEAQTVVAPGDVDVLKVDGPVPQETGSSRRWVSVVSVGSDGVPRTHLEAVPQEAGHGSGGRAKRPIRSPTHPNDPSADDEDVL